MHVNGYAVGRDTVVEHVALWFLVVWRFSVGFCSHIICRLV